MKTDHKNSLWLAIQYSISLILSLVGLKLNLLSFGQDGFGIWILLLSIWGIGSALDLGFSISTVKFIAQYKNDVIKVNNIISTSLCLYKVLGFIIAIIISIIAEYAYFRNIKLFSPEIVFSSKIIFCLLGINFYLQYITVIFRAVFDGYSNFVIPAKISLFSSVLLFLSIFMVFIFKLQLLSLAVFCIIGSFLQLVLYIYSFYKFFPNLKIRYFFVDIKTFKQIFNFSISIQITYLLGSLIDPVIKYVIGSFSDRTVIPTYEIARKFALAVSGLFSFAFRNVLPKTSVLKTRDDYSAFFNTTGLKLSNYGILFSGFFYGTFSIFFALIFKFFYENDQCMLIFLLLALAEMINNIGYVFYVLIVGMGRALFLSLLQLSNLILISGLLSLGLIIFKNNIGLIGYFFSVILGNFAMLTFLQKNTGIQIMNVYLRHNMWKFIVLLLLTFINIAVLLFRNNFGIITEIVFSILCFSLFFNDFKFYINIIIKLLFSKIYFIFINRKSSTV
jgi:O-antigen/teichoic acid export membrane protein